MKMSVPALERLLLAQATLDLDIHLLADGLGYGHKTVGGSRDPVEPLIEDLDQSLVAELRMGQGNQVVDHRHDPHPLALELFGQREDIVMPRGVQQDQLITGLSVQW